MIQNKMIALIVHKIVKHVLINTYVYHVQIINILMMMFVKIVLKH